MNYITLIKRNVKFSDNICERNFGDPVCHVVMEYLQKQGGNSDMMLIHNISSAIYELSEIVK